MACPQWLHMLVSSVTHEVKAICISARALNAGPVKRSRVFTLHCGVHTQHCDKGTLLAIHCPAIDPAYGSPYVRRVCGKRLGLPPADINCYIDARTVLCAATVGRMQRCPVVQVRAQWRASALQPIAGLLRLLMVSGTCSWWFAAWRLLCVWHWPGACAPSARCCPVLFGQPLGSHTQHTAAAYLCMSAAAFTSTCHLQDTQLCSRQQWSSIHEAGKQPDLGHVHCWDLL
jgi:hypothetical protein